MKKKVFLIIGLLMIISMIMVACGPTTPDPAVDDDIFKGGHFTFLGINQ